MALSMFAFENTAFSLKSGVLFIIMNKREKREPKMGEL